MKIKGVVMLDILFDKIWPYKAPSELDLSNLSEEHREYIITRLNVQINWYDKKSILAQKKYKLFTFFTILCTSLTPVAANLILSTQISKYVVSFLGVFATLSQGIINMSKYNENWIEYRTVCETLKKEKYMFLTNAGVYHDIEDSFVYFAERTESIISQENLNWANITKEEKEKR